MAATTFTAKFPKASQAHKFIALISGDGWGATDIAYAAGGVVTFTADDRGDRYGAWQNWAETVGYYGSSSARRALLNGIACPIGY